MNSTMARLRIAVGLVMVVFAVGTLGYWAFGLDLVDAIYMTVITITTVGYRELLGEELSDAEKLFTVGIIITGVSTVLYTFGLTVQVIVEGQLRQFIGRRRMDKQIAQLDGHVIVCGWGRVGRAAAADLRRSDRDVVIIDQHAERVNGLDMPAIVGDATVDSTLRDAGIARAAALVAALAGDADNLFVTMSAKSLNPGLFIVARARQEESVAKLSRAGADRVVNPQELGAARMASFVVQPNVAEFVDVVMHERAMDFRMQEFGIPAGSSIAGKTLRDADLRGRSGALVLALRDDSGTFTTNPSPDTKLHPGNIIIAVGTANALRAVAEVCS